MQAQRTLQVAVDNAFTVQVGEPFKHLEDICGDERFGKLAVLLDRLLERAALSESAVKARSATRRG